MRLRDTDPMPFGKYQGTPMANVPDSYLLWLYSKYKEQVAEGKEIRGDSHRVMLYIENFGVHNLKP
ncbi:MAG TPA: hypothetical protein DCY95_01685 [Algoriphagus sp.]|uniref:putative quorum-sensing-regulated virulence factor n=1 Tax=Algoriphagus sp. TaxID=1872435 RepID=UPI000C380CA7|nr:DUF3820 family protein [Algoriphagus sp.]MAL13332.1 hypothetical protein [Algoriphagus sp.]MAN85602.1 hypothetical protein [Algoriphagus sp.]HAD52690.1 hypothetical protein [Algoriphagus sp.]HAH35135.1 hypothetical protein [Algoriphagus sp.]HAS57954.1 hypothetical protein [Algoriphagus sp.]